MSNSTEATMICCACGCAMQYIGKTNACDSGYYCGCATSNAVNFDTHSMKMEIDMLKAKLEEAESNDIEVTWTPSQFKKLAENIISLLMKAKDTEGIEEFYFKTSTNSKDYEFGIRIENDRD